jgi:hypothetical protein
MQPYTKQRSANSLNPNRAVLYLMVIILARGWHIPFIGKIKNDRMNLGLGITNFSCILPSAFYMQFCTQQKLSQAFSNAIDIFMIYFLCLKEQNLGVNIVVFYLFLVIYRILRPYLPWLPG